MWRRERAIHFHIYVICSKFKCVAPVLKRWKSYVVSVGRGAAHIIIKFTVDRGAFRHRFVVHKIHVTEKNKKKKFVFEFFLLAFCWHLSIIATQKKTLYNILRQDNKWFATSTCAHRLRAGSAMNGWVRATATKYNSYTSMNAMEIRFSFCVTHFRSGSYTVRWKSSFRSNFSFCRISWPITLDKWDSSMSEVMQFIKTEILRPATDQSCPQCSSFASIELFAVLHTDFYLLIFVVVSVDLRRPPSSSHGREKGIFVFSIFGWTQPLSLSLSFRESPSSMGKIVRIWWWLSLDVLCTWSSPTKAAGNQCLCDADETSELVLNESTSGKLPVGIKLLNKRKCVYAVLVWIHREAEIVAQPQVRTHRMRFGRHALPVHRCLGHILCMRILWWLLLRECVFLSSATFVVYVRLCRLARLVAAEIEWTGKHIYIRFGQSRFRAVLAHFCRLPSLSVETANQNVILPRTEIVVQMWQHWRTQRFRIK